MRKIKEIMLVLAIIFCFMPSLAYQADAASYSQEQIDAAANALDTIALYGMADRIDIESSVDYIWKDNWNTLSRIQQVKMMRTIADAETILIGGNVRNYRIIYKDEVVAKATPKEGIEVIKRYIGDN